MASITEFDEGRSGLVGDSSTVATLRATLLELLRGGDEAVLLPGATHSQDSFTFKNLVVTLDGRDGEVPYQLFGSDWGHGVSVIRVPADAAERTLQPKNRGSTLKALVGCCRNALVATDGEDVVGPQLGNDESRDEPNDVWEAGFDGANCSVGLYSAIELAPPKGGTVGMTRASRSYFLVAKAGAGQAGQEFSAKMIGAAAKGVSLDNLFGVEAARRTGAAPVTLGQLRRVYAAGRRNRARILVQAAEALGLGPDVESAPDHACCDEAQGQQIAILLADACTNVLEPVQASGGDDDLGSRWRYYAGAVAPAQSQGLVSCSAVSEGFVLFLDPSNEGNPVRLTNHAHGSMPFGSKRVMRTFDALLKASEAHLAVAGGADEEVVPERTVHPDAKWMATHFAWAPPRKPRRARSAAVTRIVEPPQLWGTHAPLGHSAWSHALGLGQLRDVRLSPEVVALAGAEPDAHRAVVGRISAKEGSADY